MNNDIASIVERARAATAQKPAEPASGGSSERSRLQKVAQEFESMLLTQMLRDMRKSGEWENEESQDTFGAETMYDTMDVELAGHLAKVQGLGLSKQLLQAFDRYNVKPSGSESQASGLQLPASVERTPVPSAVTPMPESAAALVKKIVASSESLNVTSASALSPDPRGLGPSTSPLDGKVTSSFGWRHDPFTGQAKFHKGVDLRAAYGQDVRAAGDGKVVFSGPAQEFAADEARHTHPVRAPVDDACVGGRLGRSGAGDWPGRA